jgi:hypothetical protein
MRFLGHEVTPSFTKCGRKVLFLVRRESRAIFCEISEKKFPGNGGSSCVGGRVGAYCTLGTNIALS